MAALLLMGAVSAQLQMRTSDEVRVSESNNLTVKSNSFSANRAVIYSEDFETTSIEQLPPGWFKSTYGTYAFIVCNDQNNYPVDSYQGNIPGVLNIVLPYAGSKFLAQGWQDSGRGNWVISAGFSLTAGTPYEISFQFAMPGYSSEINSFECRIGKTPTEAAMASAHLVYSITQKIANWTLVTHTFTPAETGTYYLYFKDSTPIISGGYGIYHAIDDIIITGNSSPSNVTITTNVIPTGAGWVTGGGTYPVGALVTLTATAHSGYEFLNWNTGSITNPLSFYATANATYTANFKTTTGEEEDVLVIKFLDNTTVSYPIANIQRIKFNNNYLLLKPTTGTEKSYLLDNIASIKFITEVGIEEFFNVIDVDIFINSNGEITVESLHQIYKLAVFDLLGREVATSTSCKMNVNFLNTGLYILQVATEKGYVNRKFIKN